MESKRDRIDVELAAKLAEVDMQSLYAEHIQMWEIFANAIRLMLLAISLPFLSGGVLISAHAIDVSELSDLRHLPPIMTFITLGSGILGILMLLVVIHYRLDVLLYSRAINGFRAFYVATLLNVEPHFSTPLNPNMPTSSDIPKYYEPFREVGILVFGFACVNSAYLTLSMVNLCDAFLKAFALAYGDAWRYTLIAGFGTLLVVVQYLAYFLLTRRKPIAGYKNKRAGNI